MLAEYQIEAGRRTVRNMLHAADNGNHLGEAAIVRMAASRELLALLCEFLGPYEDLDSAVLFRDLSNAEAERIIRARAVVAEVCGETQ